MQCARVCVQCVSKNVGALNNRKKKKKKKREEGEQHTLKSTQRSWKPGWEEQPMSPHASTGLMTLKMVYMRRSRPSGGHKRSLALITDQMAVLRV